MSNTVISIENLSKVYRLGQIGTGTLTNDLKVWWARAHGEPNPLVKIGQQDHGNRVGEDLWALRDVSFTVQQGEVLGIIGRNGAGKSTLLKILSRVTAPTKGHARVKGRIASLLEVGTGFHPDLTGRENIYLNGSILGMKRKEIERKFDEIVEFAEISQFIETPVKRYSSGMYVRLAFAVAAHLEPEILLVDEVLAVGDAAFQKKCLGKMGDVARDGRTVLFVSHNMGAVTTLCKQAIYISKGSIVSTGFAKAVVTEYLSTTLVNPLETLSEIRLPGMGKEIKFVDILLISKNGSNIFFGEQIQVNLEFLSSVNLNNLTIGGSIFTNTGICIGTFFSEKQFSIRANQKITLSLTISNPSLAPGPYQMGFSVGRGGREGSRYDYDIVIGRPYFYVMPISNKENHVAAWKNSWGNIVLQETELVIKENAL